MNILYVLNSTYALGGATKSLLTLLKSVMRHGHTPTVVAPDEDGVVSTLRQMGIAVIAVPYRNNTYPDARNIKEKILFLPRLLMRRILIRKAVQTVYEQVKTRNIAIVHTNVSVVDVGERVAEKLGVPHIYHIREYADLDFHLRYYPSSKVFHRRLAQNYTLCITRAIQQHHHLVGNPKSMVVYNGITITGEQRSGTLPKRPYFLYAGRIEECKGLYDLAVAYTLFTKKKGTEFTALAIAGDIAEEAYYRKTMDFLRNNGFTEKEILYLGPRKDMVSLMSHAVATIVPSYFEGFGRCLPEAMLSQSITIGRDTAGTKEQFDNGLQCTGKEIGYRFHDINELEQCLNEVCSTSAEELQSMRERALLTVRKYYSPERYTDSIINLYEKIERERTH